MNKVQTQAKAKEFTVDYNELLNEVITKKGIISQCFSVFHEYSINNQFLAYWQLKCKGYGLSPLATFNKWNSLDRHIKKGERALYMWLPIGGYPKKVIDNETGEEKTVFVGQKFKYINRWFSLDQTTGKELNMPVTALNCKEFNFENIYKKYNIKLIKFDKANGNIQGYARTERKELAINPLAEDVEMTILHEVAHIACEHSGKRKDLSKELKEVEAETIAYIVGSVINVTEEELTRSRGYIQSFLKENKIPEANAKHIMKIANDIIKAGFNK